MAEHLGDTRPQPPGHSAGVQLRLDHDPALGKMQTAGEPEQCGYLRLAAARLNHLDPAELILSAAAGS